MVNQGGRARRNVLLVIVLAAFAIAAPLGAGGTPAASPLGMTPLPPTWLAAGALIPPAYLDEWGSDGSGDGQFSTVMDIAVHSSGIVAVSDQTLHRIQQFDTQGNYVRQWGSVGTAESEFNRAWGLAVDLSGNVYVSDYDNHRVQKFDSAGNFLLMWGGGVVSGTDTFEICTSTCVQGTAGATAGQFNLPMGLTVDSAGKVYVGVWANNKIQVYGSDGTYLTSWGTWGTSEGQFTGGPADVAVDSDGYVYTCEADNARVQVFDKSGNFVRMWGYGVDDGTSELQVCTSGCQAGLKGSADWQFYDAMSLAVDSQDNVYVVDFTNDRVLKFNRGGNPLVWWDDGNGALNLPNGIDIEGLSLYLGDRANFRVIKYGGPYFETFVGEPEPGTEVSR